MRKIELTEQEVQSIIAQLETLPMAKVKNIVYFLDEKLRKASDAKQEELDKKE